MPPRRDRNLWVQFRTTITNGRGSLWVQEIQLNHLLMDYLYIVRVDIFSNALAYPITFLVPRLTSKMG
jgi:hypothetical protein